MLCDTTSKEVLKEHLGDFFELFLGHRTLSMSESFVLNFTTSKVEGAFMSTWAYPNWSVYIPNDLLPQLEKLKSFLSNKGYRLYQGELFGSNKLYIKPSEQDIMDKLAC